MFAHRGSGALADHPGEEPRALQRGPGALPGLAAGLLFVLGEANLEKLLERAVVQAAVRELLMDPVGTRATGVAWPSGFNNRENGSLTRIPGAGGRGTHHARLSAWFAAAKSPLSQYWGSTVTCSRR